MLRRAAGTLFGSYVLNARLVADWWQPFYREDTHSRAKERLQELQSSAWYKYYMHNRSRGRDPGTPASTGAEDDATGSAAAADADELLEPTTSPESELPFEMGDELGEAASPLVEESIAYMTDQAGEDCTPGDPFHVGENELPHPAAAATTTMGTASAAAAASSSSSSSSLPFIPPGPMHLYEANALVTTFTNQHNLDGLSSLLGYIREGLGQPLTPFHYHALLRVLAYRLEHAEALEVLEVLVDAGAEETTTTAAAKDGEGDLEVKEEDERGGNRGSPLVTLETYARVMDLLHCLSPEDVLERLLRVVALAQERFSLDMDVELPSLLCGPSSSSAALPADGAHKVATDKTSGRTMRLGVLWSRDCAGSEGATVAGFSTQSEAGRMAAEDPHVMPGPLADDMEEEAEEAARVLASCSPPSHHTTTTTTTTLDRSAYTSPPLTSLLHHLSTSTRFSALAPLLVALWIRSLGLPLGDWDQMLLLHAILSKRSTFPFVSWCIGSFAAYDNRRSSPPSPSSSLQERTGVGSGRVAPGWVLHQLEERKRTIIAHHQKQTSTLHKAADSSVGKHTTPGGLAELEALTPLLLAMQDSLCKAHVSMDTPVDMGPWMNTGVVSLEGYVDGVLLAVERTGRGLGPHGYNPAQLHHMLTLLYSITRDNTSAVEMLRRSLEGRERWRRAAAAIHKTHGAEADGNEDDAGRSPGNMNGGLSGPAAAMAAGRHAATGGLVAATSLHRGARPDTSTAYAGEPYHIPMQHLLDVGSLLDRVSRRTVRGIRDAYTTLAQETAADATRARQEAELLLVSSRSAKSLDTAPRVAAPTSSEVEAEASDAFSYSNAAARSSPAALCASLSLAVPLSLPPLADVTSCESYSIPMLESTADALAALRHVVSITNPTLTHQPRHIRLLYKQVALFCALHPRPNPKLTPAGLAARRKWMSYLEARDTALTLFGSVQRARDTMKDIFYKNYTLPAMRSAERVEEDVKETTALLARSSCFCNWEAGEKRRKEMEDKKKRDGMTTTGGTAAQSMESNSTNDLNFFEDSPSSSSSATREETPKGGEESDALVPPPPPVLDPSLRIASPPTRPGAAKKKGNAAADVSTLAFLRQTVPHLGATPDMVPRYLYDPEVYNPYPHVLLRIPVVEQQTAGKDRHKAYHRETEEEEEDDDVDLFAELWNTLMQTEKVGSDVWYLHNTDMFFTAAAAAVDLTLRVREKTSVTYRMDQAITGFFREIGDPAGCLAFKVATKLFDGRIMNEGQKEEWRRMERESSLLGLSLTHTRTHTYMCDSQRQQQQTPAYNIIYIVPIDDPMPTPLCLRIVLLFFFLLLFLLFFVFLYVFCVLLCVDAHGAAYIRGAMNPFPPTLNSLWRRGLLLCTVAQRYGKVRRSCLRQRQRGIPHPTHPHTHTQTRLFLYIFIHIANFIGRSKLTELTTPLYSTAIDATSNSRTQRRGSSVGLAARVAEEPTVAGAATAVISAPHPRSLHATAAHGAERIAGGREAAVGTPSTGMIETAVGGVTHMARWTVATDAGAVIAAAGAAERGGVLDTDETGRTTGGEEVPGRHHDDDDRRRRRHRRRRRESSSSYPRSRSTDSRRSRRRGVRAGRSDTKVLKKEDEDKSRVPPPPKSPDMAAADAAATAGGVAEDTPHSEADMQLLRRQERMSATTTTTTTTTYRRHAEQEEEEEGGTLTLPCPLAANRHGLFAPSQRGVLLSMLPLPTSTAASGTLSDTTATRCTVLPPSVQPQPQPQHQHTATPVPQAWPYDPIQPNGRTSEEENGEGSNRRRPSRRHNAATDETWEDYGAWLLADRGSSVAVPHNSGGRPAVGRSPSPSPMQQQRRAAGTGVQHDTGGGTGQGPAAAAAAAAAAGVWSGPRFPPVLGPSTQDWEEMCRTLSFSICADEAALRQHLPASSPLHWTRGLTGTAAAAAKGGGDDDDPQTRPIHPATGCSTTNGSSRATEEMPSPPSQPGADHAASKGPLVKADLLLYPMQDMTATYMHHFRIGKVHLKPPWYLCAEVDDNCEHPQYIPWLEERARQSAPLNSTLEGEDDEGEEAEAKNSSADPPPDAGADGGAGDLNHQTADTAQQEEKGQQQEKEQTSPPCPDATKVEERLKRHRHRHRHQTDMTVYDVLLEGVVLGTVEEEVERAKSLLRSRQEEVVSVLDLRQFFFFLFFLLCFACLFNCNDTKRGDETSTEEKNQKKQWICSLINDDIWIYAFFNYREINTYTFFTLPLPPLSSFLCFKKVNMRRCLALLLPLAAAATTTTTSSCSSIAANAALRLRLRSAAAAARPSSVSSLTTPRCFASDVPLADIVRRELDEETTRSGKPSEPSPPSGWTVKRTPGTCTFELTRTYEDETICVRYAPTENTDVNYHEITVFINQQAKKGHTLQVDLTVEECELVLDSICYHEDAALAMDETAEADMKRAKMYPGPKVSELDDAMLDAFIQFLEKRGVGQELGEFVSLYSFWAEQQEYEKWLQRIHDFVA
eukprot:gene5847-4170_t